MSAKEGSELAQVALSDAFKSELVAIVDTVNYAFLVKKVESISQKLVEDVDLDEVIQYLQEQGRKVLNIPEPELKVKPTEDGSIFNKEQIIQHINNGAKSFCKTFDLARSVIIESAYESQAGVNK